jgi:hypothetical protein
VEIHDDISGVVKKAGLKTKRIPVEIHDDISGVVKKAGLKQSEFQRKFMMIFPEL